MYEKLLLGNGIYKIETLALDDMNDLICFYKDKDGAITDDGYLFNELSNQPRFMAENFDYVSEMINQCHEVAEQYGVIFTDDFEFTVKCDDESRAITRLIQVATLITNLY